MVNLLKDKKKLEKDLDNSKKSEKIDNEDKKEYFNSKNDIIFSHEIDEPVDADNSEANNQKKSEKKININSYVDPAGVTMKKLRMGLWFVENKQNIMILLKGILLIVGVVTWGIFFYTFIKYFAIDMRADEIHVNTLFDNTVADHNFILSQSPQNLQFDSAQVIKNLDNSYDFLVSVFNPNLDIVSSFEYFVNINGVEKGRTNGFVLPGEKKYLIVLGVDASGNLINTNIDIDNLNWDRINKHVYPDWNSYAFNHLNVTAEDINFIPSKTTVLSEKLSLNELEFTVNNKTPYNYWNVDFTILLYSNNRIVSINKYVANNLMSDQKKSVKITWPGHLNHVTNIEIIPEINIMLDNIYIDFEGEVDDLR